MSLGREIICCAQTEKSQITALASAIAPYHSPDTGKRDLAMAKLAGYAAVATVVVTTIRKLLLVHVRGDKGIDHMAAAVFELERRQGLAER